jgi:hypothetical protein
VQHQSYETHEEEATQSLLGYINVFYNRQYLYSTVRHRSPVELENSLKSPMPCPLLVGKVISMTSQKYRRIRGNPTMMSRLLIFTLLLSALCSAPAAEIPFEKVDEFPASAYGLIAEKRVVWLGELHGTCEAPQLFLGLVKLVSRRHTAPPIVALEIPSSEQGAIDRYLATGDDSTLRSSVFFSGKLKDGRSSEAMVKLLSQLRAEKTAAVYCFDSPGATTPQERDTAMAQSLHRCAKKFPNSKLVVLSGSVHSRIVEGTSWDPNYRPAAFELRKTLDSVVSFRLAYEAGTIWAHTDNGFGEHKVKGDRWSGTTPHYITLFPKPADGHNGAIFTRTLTGSPPWK